MVGFHQLQTRNLHIQIHALLDTGVSGAQGLDFGKGQRRFVHIIAGADRAFAGHDLRNEFLFVLHRLPQVGIESSLSNIAVHMDQRILVTLALDTALALGKISRTPRTIQVRADCSYRPDRQPQSRLGRSGFRQTVRSVPAQNRPADGHTSRAAKVQPRSTGRTA